MNPKEMTNEALIEYCRCYPNCRDELLRRLNEADALRKENAALRGDNSDLLAKSDAFVFVHNNMAADMNALRKENEELACALEGIRMMLPSNRSWTPEECQVVRVYNARAARLAKESEASE